MIHLVYGKEQWICCFIFICVRLVKRNEAHDTNDKRAELCISFEFILRTFFYYGFWNDFQWKKFNCMGIELFILIHECIPVQYFWKVIILKTCTSFMAFIVLRSGEGRLCISFHSFNDLIHISHQALLSLYYRNECKFFLHTFFLWLLH